MKSKGSIFVVPQCSRCGQSLLPSYLPSEMTLSCLFLWWDMVLLIFVETFRLYLHFFFFSEQSCLRIIVFLVVPILCFFLVLLKVLDCFHSFFFEQILACYLLFFFNYLDVCSWALKFYFFGCHCFFSVQQLEWCKVCRSWYCCIVCPNNFW